MAEPRRWVGQLRRVLGARAIRGSNSIEGHVVSVEDALAAIEGEQPTTAAQEDWRAVSGYRRAMTYVLQLAQDGFFAYTPQTIRALHFMMTEYALDAGPALWRPGPIWIRNDATGDIVYEAPDAEQVPDLIDELVAELAGDRDTPPLIRAAMAHLNLVMIHPFRDGNGRMSRCLQTLVLARERILVPEFASIEEYLGANASAYYGVLQRVGGQRWDPERDARPWLRFCLTAHYVQAASVLRRVRESEQIWVRLDALRAERRLPERTMAALFDAAVGLRIRNASYRAALRDWGDDISNQVATTDLRLMVAGGLLAQLGAKRGTHYEASPLLRGVRDELQRGRAPIDPDSLFALS